MIMRQFSCDTNASYLFILARKIDRYTGTSNIQRDISPAHTHKQINTQTVK